MHSLMSFGSEIECLPADQSISGWTKSARKLEQYHEAQYKIISVTIPLEGLPAAERQLGTPKQSQCPA